MKETGLMFKAPLVRAILAGRKTQTRRIVKWNELQKGLNLGFSGLRATETATGWVLESNSRTSREWRCKVTPCPMGQAGDRIYVRETWQGPLLSGKEWEDHYFSGADDLPANFRTPAHCQYAADGGPPPEFMTMDDELVSRWKPSIHMPKWAARTWLEVTGVRVERLQEISEQDAIAEGAEPHEWNVADPHGLIDWPLKESAAPYRNGFAHLWESTGARWDDNPWVWVCDFKRIERTQAQKDCTT